MISSRAKGACVLAKRQLHWKPMRRSLFALALAISACGGAGKPASAAKPSAAISSTEGFASWYGPGFAGRKTANGEVFDPEALTMAHRTLPFGTRVRVTNLDNGKSVIVRVNDRGPTTAGRIADLSQAAAEQIDMVRSGVVEAKLEVLSVMTSR